MARIRTIKPDFFTSEKIGALPMSARLTFIGLWTHADDNGVAIDNERLIAAAIWPLEEDPLETLRTVSGDLQRLSTAGLIVRYELSGRRYLFITGWDEHQRISHPSKPRYPRPPADLPPPANSEDATFEPSSGGPPEVLGSPSENLRPEQGTGNREQGKEEKTSSEAPPPDVPRRLDVERLCNHLADRIEANGSKRPTVGKKWRDAARLLMDADGKTEEQVRTAIDWCQDSEFWRSNILSMPTLRDQYDRLRLQARSSPPSKYAPGSDPHLKPGAIYDPEKVI